MFASPSLRSTLQYDQQSCQLRLEGLPDLSAGQASTDLGILTSWNLRWAGRPELEGERPHLEALIATVLPYARHLVSGVCRPFGNPEGPIAIGPDGQGGHRLRLVSSQEGNPTLELDLDDAELADLVRVIDRVRLDPRLRLPLPAPEQRPLRARELIRRVPLQRRLAAPIGGMAALAIAATLASLLPTPAPLQQRPAQSTPAAASQGRP